MYGYGKAQPSVRSHSSLVTSQNLQFIDSNGSDLHGSLGSSSSSGRGSRVNARMTENLRHGSIFTPDPAAWPRVSDSQTLIPSAAG